jgi:hypothetical protein
MAQIKTCDFCKKSEPHVAFGAAENKLPTDSVVSFTDSLGAVRSVTVAVASGIKPGIDVCTGCSEQILTAGVEDIAKRRRQQQFGVFVAGANTQARVDQPTANRI